MNAPGVHYKLSYPLTRVLQGLLNEPIEVTTINGLTFSGARWGVFEDLLHFFIEPNEPLIGGSTTKVRIVPEHIVSIRVLSE
jgi:hypothetical protein